MLRQVPPNVARFSTQATRIPYAEIPGWKRSTVPGHAGELVVGTLSGKPVAVMKGRLHYYEGYDIADVPYPIRVRVAYPEGGIANWQALPCGTRARALLTAEEWMRGF